MFFPLWLKRTAGGRREPRMLTRLMHRAAEALTVISVRPRHFRSMMIDLQKGAGLVGDANQELIT